MKSFITLLAVAFLAVGTQAATAKKTKKMAAATTETTQIAYPAEQSTASLNTVPTFSITSLKGFSAYAGLNMNQTLVVDDASDADMERDIMLGLQYDMAPLNPGLHMSYGSTFDFNRSIADTNGELSTIIPYVLLNFRLSQKATFNAGLNYTFPSLSGLSGVTAKSDFGYQFGLTFAASEKFNVDVNYRMANFDLEAGRKFDAHLPGLNVMGRYSF